MTTQEELKKNLNSYVEEGKWPEVVKLYSKDPRAHTTKLIKSGDTALHMAIDEGKDDYAKELVELVGKSGNLSFQNNLGNTALHLAARQGNVRLCRTILAHDTGLNSLMDVSNKAHETPLYVAAKHGRKEPFLCMHRLCTSSHQKNRHKNLRREEDRRTILHAAISGEHFDLAYQIIHLYPKLVNLSDKRDFLPLHILARMPYVFKSGYPMGYFHKLIYLCIKVEELKFVDEDKAKNTFRRNLQWLKRGSRVPKTDTEDPQLDQPEGQSQELVPGKHGKRLCCLTLILKGMETISGLGIKNIREEKQKHTWSVQIMKKLLEKSPTKNEEYGSPNKDEQPPDQDDDGQSLRYKISLVTPNLRPEKTSENVNDQPDPKHGIAAKGTEKNLSRPTPKQSTIKVVEKIMEASSVTVDIIQKEKSGGVTGNVTEDTPLLVAAKHGIIEMVKEILNKFPAAIHDVNAHEKNIVLLAVENRQPDIYQFLLNQKTFYKNTIFYQTDKDGNSALHLAAVLSDEQSWNIPGPALHMQWEIKWYQFVEKSMPAKFFVKYNEKGETSWDIFRVAHKGLVLQAGKWLNETSDSCSIVSILIATVAFAAYATVPGGINNDTGTPVLAKNTLFHVFAISSLIALCFSISSVVMFLVFFTSRYHEKDFAFSLPLKFLVELLSLMIAVAALLVSFCAAHSFVIKDSLKFTAFPLYAATLLPIALYASWQVPTYCKLTCATFRETPQRIYKDN